MQIVQRSTQHVKNYVDSQNNNKVALKDLFQILFDQFKEVAQAHLIFLNCLDKASKAHNLSLNTYNMFFYWNKVQTVMQLLLMDYLDVQNTSSDLQISSTAEVSDINSYFSRRKQQRWLVYSILVKKLIFGVSAKRNRCLSLMDHQVLLL